MKVVFDPLAERDLDAQLTYLIDHGAASAARQLEQRLAAFIQHTVLTFPRAGTYIAQRNIWETWVPKTKLIVWYRFTTDELQIVRIWHTSQDRDAAN